ncbi:hypothetical protein DXG01_000220 [Tephrocybe rancida]|nr:hypothetical protein DXG01_000220 [Tephrocybe rancida]
MAGLLEWSNAIRFTMANDPGREIFQGQLNTHGFIFLDDYLDNILCGPSQDPIIELVKTPGRKKVMSKKAKALGSSKLSTMSSLTEDVESKENIAPLNTFHKALLQAKAQPVPHATNISLPPQQVATSDFFNTPLAASPDLAPSMSIVGPLNDGLLAPGRSDQNNLSIIAEDDEQPESSRKDSKLPLTQTSPALPQPGIPDSATIAESSSDIFHSITLDSPLPNVPEIPHRESPPIAPAPGVHGVESTDVLQSSRKPDSLPPSANMDVTSAALTVEPQESDLDLGRDFEMPLRDQEQTSADKFATALFPTLPAPMPLRKSVRTPRDPSDGTGLLGAATPSAPPGGKRTSGLKKAREVKALEVTIKHTSAPPPVQGPPPLNILKRKSSDLLSSLDAPVPEDEGRLPKSSKSNVEDEAPLRATPETQKVDPEPRQPSPPPIVEEGSGQVGMLDRFKRTVEDLGARVGKSMGKSLGAAAATSALAEARAAAEARVAERHNKEEEMTRISGPASAPTIDTSSTNNSSAIPTGMMSGTSIHEERRLSISDLFPPMDSSIKMKDKSTKTIINAKRDPTTSPELRPSPLRSPIANNRKSNRESTTTTPPDSPPASRPTSFVLPTGPVFNKPPPVFVAPVTTSLPPMSVFPMPAPISLGLGTRLPSPSSSKLADPLSRQSTMESVQSARIFDDTDAPAWMPETQDTDYSSRFDSQSQNPYQDTIDEDDSWPIDEKLAPGVQWTFGANLKEDSMTWSTLPSQSQRGDTTTSHSYKEPNAPQASQDDDARPARKAVPGAFDVDMDDDFEVNNAQSDKELEDIVLHNKPTTSLAEVQQSDSQLSMASSQSSQSHTGFLGQASRLIGSALGTSKKGNDVKKVLQMAAVAAKKQQEETDKKTARLKEMENRRHLAIQRKAEEEKARTLEQEKKAKEEGERRKREREENTDKRPLKTTVKKDEDLTKKRKFVTADGEKRELKKPLPKPILKSSSKPPSALSSSAAYNASHQTGPPSTSSNDPKSSKQPTPAAGTLLKGKGKAQNASLINTDDDLSQPSQLVQIQMAARAKAQIQAAQLASEPTVTSESIELPEINSEYSDSEDEDRPKSFPVWAQSPELKQALQLQSTINPDDIFGAIRPLRMEEMFKTRTSRFRARTSSANWTGADRLTMEEEREYAKRMGFR